MATDPRAAEIAAALPVKDGERFVAHEPTPDNTDPHIVDTVTGDIVEDCITMAEAEGRAAERNSEEPERIPLADIVVTAIEHNEFSHFRTRFYDPDADGVTHPWAIIEPFRVLDSDPPKPAPVVLNAETIRKGVEAYLSDRLAKGMNEDEARMMVDGVYTDVIVCDSIIQFIAYGGEVLS